MIKPVLLTAVTAMSMLCAGGAVALDDYVLAGAAKGDPSVVTYKFGGQDVVAVFVRGPGGLMYAQVGDIEGDDWTGWAPIGAEVLKSSPACVATTTSLIDCVAAGKNNNVFHVRYNAKKHAWSSWENLGGFATGAPGLARTIDEDGEIVLSAFVRGPADLLFIDTLIEDDWSDWQSLDVKVSGDVACTDILVVGAHCYDTGSGSAAQYSDLTRTSGVDIFVDQLGGAIDGKVSAVATGKSGDTLRVFVNGPGHRLWFKKWHGSWEDWVQLPTTVLSAPGCAIQKGGSIAWCAGVEPDGSVKMIKIGTDEL